MSLSNVSVPTPPVPIQSAAIDSPLSVNQRRSLLAVLGSMIPASEAFEVPGADDPLIVADLLNSLKSQAPALVTALDRLDALCGQSFHTLAADAQPQALDDFRRADMKHFALLVTLCVQCYYRDDRVMRSLGMEARAPFPKGFEVPAGDYDLLDPVRARGPIWRDPTG
jgi:hypothetical protein